MNEKYITRIRAIPEAEAQELHDKWVAWGESAVRSAQEELERLKAAPLIRETRYQEVVQPGHPDYDKASFHFNPSDYAGEWRWKKATE